MATKKKKKVTRRAPAVQVPDTGIEAEDILRVTFAAAAVSGLCANPKLVSMNSEEVAETAFDVADHMMEEFESYEEVDEDEEDEEEEEDEEDDDD